MSKPTVAQLLERIVALEAEVTALKANLPTKKQRSVSEPVFTGDWEQCRQYIIANAGKKLFSRRHNDQFGVFH